MSIYSVNETGVKMYRSRFNLSHRKIFDCDFADLIPFCAKFVLPGDVWKIGANALIRYQPTLAPSLTRANARFRYFFVPLRLVEKNIESIITGSKDGHLISGELPTCSKIFDTVTSDDNYNVVKYSFYDYLGIPLGNYKDFSNNSCIPAAYWYKSYLRIFWDYYRDENLYSEDDFDNFESSHTLYGGHCWLMSASLRKDYFTSALPWQLKGITPTFSIDSHIQISTPSGNDNVILGSVQPDASFTLKTESHTIPDVDAPIVLNDASFNMDDLRTMAAQTRVFERLARTGSRYTSYLSANFGTAPADGTLQRAQYLGGFKQPIVTTEVVQTGPETAESSAKVGTLRGHGISSGGNSIKPFVAKEFGVIFGIMDILPDVQYTQGINRELTYTSRFDFFNPSFQHLSEQEIRNGEIFIANDGKNDDTFGFQPIYNELRKSTDIVVGDMRDTLSYWTQAIHFDSRPYLNFSFISADSYKNSFKQPFAVQSGSMPIICDIGNVLDVYRPMVRYSTPGLIDHN